MSDDVLFHPFVENGVLMLRVIVKGHVTQIALAEADISCLETAIREMRMAQPRLMLQCTQPAEGHR